ncbi:MAG: LTA synthase family protein [Lachnospiraceae bacterium]|nr:LTA synthase family protein [Lachnospiraceae bacterium]
MDQKKINRKAAVAVGVKIILTVCLCAFFAWFLLGRELCMDNAGLYAKGKIVSMSVLTLLAILFLWIPNPFQEKKRVNTVLLLAVTFFAGILNFVGMEYVSGNFAKLRHLIGLANLVVIYFLMMTIFAIFNRIKVSVTVTTAALYVFTLGNYFTMLFRGIPILASDLLLIRTAMSVAGDFVYKINYNVLVYSMFLLLILILLARIPEQERLPRKLRFAYLGSYAVVLGVFLYIFCFSDTLSKYKVKVNHFNPSRSYAMNGSIMTFARSVQMVGLDKPKGYSPEKVEQLAQPYVQAYEEDTAEYRTPNVIVVMNEAFADLQAINGAFETNVDVMPVIHSLKEDVIKGTAYSSVFGGYTANSEYEFLTGHSMAHLNGVVPFQFLIKKPMASLASRLDKLGYDGLLAIHPYKKQGYNRDVAYNKLGFSDFIAIEDMNDREHEYVRNLISDADDSKEVILQYEKIRQQSDQPVFIYNVTMQNHAGWEIPFDNFTPDVEILDSAPEYQTYEVKQYLSLIKLSDAALGQLIDYFSRVDEDTVIVFFGDHEPKLSSDFFAKMLGKKVSALNAEETMQRYEVPYVIWANYDIEEKDYGDISLNYLSCVLADATGMKLTPYQRYLMDLYEKVPVITNHGYWDKDHKFYEDVDAQSPYKEILEQYEYTQYNNLSDTGNRVENFFD